MTLLAICTSLVTFRLRDLRIQRAALALSFRGQFHPASLYIQLIRVHAS